MTHAVIYTDGSARPNPGRTGWGAHGYRITLDDKKKSKVDGYFTTTNGYKTQQELKDTDLQGTAIEYYDFTKFVSQQSTNNVGELMATIEVLKYFSDKDIQTLTIMTDSEYVRRTVSERLEGWVKDRWSEPVANIDIWKQYHQAQEACISKGIKVSLQWVKGHENYGNIIADKLALISVIKGGCQPTYESFKVTPGDMYTKDHPVAHDLIDHRNLYFSNHTSEDIGVYYMSEPEDGAMSLGKPHTKSSYSVVILKTPDPVIELVKKIHRSHARYHICTAAAKLDIVFNPEVARYISSYDNGAIIPDTGKFRSGMVALNYLDDRNVTNELIPSGLAFAGIEVLGMLHDLLVKFMDAGEYDRKMLGPDYDVIDITGQLYDMDKKQALKKELVVGIKNTKIHVEVDLPNLITPSEINLVFGGDILSRNALKRIEDKNPMLYLVVWAEGPAILRHVCIVKIDDAVGIWSNYHSNRVLVS